MAIDYHHAWPLAQDRTEDIRKVLEELWLSQDLNRIRYPMINKYMIIGDRVEETRKVTVHTFTVGDVEDPDLYAAEPLIAWEKSPEGQWVMKHAIEVPEWHRIADPATMGYRYAIVATLTGPRLTEWLLRFK